MFLFQKQNFLPQGKYCFWLQSQNIFRQSLKIPLPQRQIKRLNFSQKSKQIRTNIPVISEFSLFHFKEGHQVGHLV